MRIKRVSLSKFKGITAAYDLAPVTIIIGPNGSGKTAITTAIKLGLAGQLPTLGKKPQTLYKLATDPEHAGSMAIALTTDPAGVITHDWTRNEKGVVSYNGNIPPGVGWSEAMLDFNAFRQLTGAEQAREMFARCKTDAKPLDYLDALDTVTGANPDVSRKQVADIRDELGRSADESMPLGRWIEGAEAHLKQLVSTLNNEEKSESAVLKAFSSERPVKPQGYDASAHEKLIKELDAEQNSVAANTNVWRRYERDLAAHNMDEERKTSDHIEEVKRVNQAEAHIRSEISQVEKLPACPTCGANSEGWRDKHIGELEHRIKVLKEASNNKLNEINARPVRPKPSKPEDTGRAKADRIAELQARVSAMNLLKRGIESYENWARGMERAELASSRATVRLAVAKQCLKRLQDWRDRLMADGIGAVLAVAERFTEGLLDAKIEWHGGRGEFGRRTDKGWVSLDTFSGFEEQLALAALSVAIASDTKIKLVIMDELGRMTEQHKAGVVKRMAGLIQAGVIDQFIGVDVEESAAYKGCKIIGL